MENNLLQTHESLDKKILDVNYKYFLLDNDDELFVTRYGLKHGPNLLPDNFLLDEKWFDTHSEKLNGTSIVYKVTTKPARGKSSRIVIKWNRMGQDIPGIEPDDPEFNGASFLSPFEEFQHVQELYENVSYLHKSIELQEPLAIYIPSAKKDYLRDVRKDYIMNHVVNRHKGDIKIDIDRSYIMIYRWIDGLDAIQAMKLGYLSEDEALAITRRADREIQACGYHVRDNKAIHVILKPIGSNLLRAGDSSLVYGYVDYELMQRTEKLEKIVRKKRRSGYLAMMPKRLEYHPISEFKMKRVNIFQVPYIYGDVPETKGRLWVVGNDARLFDYFLPEKWLDTKRTKLSLYHDLYYTVSKDDIHLVLKISKVGEQPDADPFNEYEHAKFEFGYNSPFEEFSLALELNRKDLATIYPRAIYMSGTKSNISERFLDRSRYKSHTGMCCPHQGRPILQEGHEYIMILGYWNGSDEMLASYDGNYYSAINALGAYRNHIIDKEQYFQLMRRVNEQLKARGIEDLYFRGTHILLSLDAKNNLITGPDNLPLIRICNFESLRRMDEQKPDQKTENTPK